MTTYRYIALFDTVDGETTAHDITAPDIKTAHAIATAHAADLVESAAVLVDRIRLFVATTDTAGQMDGGQIMEAVALIVRRKTANMMEAEASDFMLRLWREARRPDSRDADLLDLHGEATAALVNAIADGLAIDDQYRAAYRALDRYLWASRAVNLSRNAMRTVYIEDLNGDIIAVNDRIASILSPAARYNPTFDIDDSESATANAAIIAAIVARLTPTRREIVKRLAQGMSLRQIAAAMNRTAPTINNHVKAIRAMAAAMYPDIAAAVTAEETRRAKAEAARQAAEENRCFDTDIWH